MSIACTSSIPLPAVGYWFFAFPCTCHRHGEQRERCHGNLPLNVPAGQAPTCQAMSLVSCADCSVSMLTLSKANQAFTAHCGTQLVSTTQKLHGVGCAIGCQNIQAHTLKLLWRCATQTRNISMALSGADNVLPDVQDPDQTSPPSSSSCHSTKISYVCAWTTHLNAKGRTEAPQTTMTPAHDAGNREAQGADHPAEGLLKE